MHTIYLTTVSKSVTGVIGLTTAIEIQESGKYEVAIVADHFPEDGLSIRYTRCWAVSVFLDGNVMIC